jgi:hypothetical protein
MVPFGYVDCENLDLAHAERGRPTIGARTSADGDGQPYQRPQVGEGWLRVPEEQRWGGDGRPRGRWQAGAIMGLRGANAPTKITKV